jgi:hypothetical protein
MACPTGVQLRASKDKSKQNNQEKRVSKQVQVQDLATLLSSL